MRIERDDHADFNARGTVDDGLPGWGIQIWAKHSDQDGAADFEYRVVDGKFDQSVPPELQGAILALIAKWEDSLPVMVAAPIKD